ncbi:hypothetical protein [Flaviflexus equikiangi]|uniref:Uncharacterized protein n=1 Tax=Flaviflexus equikiangi TaxID=2758573 RepID=A0ABS2TCH3_9ACTO|nr:hypothetical protein [Flaviflexus equikiangi]MBM9432336.1 hypothetical protein [Flaviflexus equikiangi]
MTSGNGDPISAEDLKGCFTAVLKLSLVLTFLIAGLVLFGMLQGDDEDALSAYSAERACTTEVSNRLKAPSTADIKVTSKTENSDGWSFGGTVDAENSFGANIRSNWICNATQENDSWNVRVWID